MKRWIAAALIGLLFSTSALAKFAHVETEQVPTDRLIANVAKKLDTERKNQALRATLARLHAMAFATQREKVTVRKGTDEPFDGYTGPAIPWTTVPATGEEALKVAKEHLATAVKLYREVVAAEPRNLVVRLGLGWCLVQAGEKAEAASVLRTLVADAWAKDEKSDSALGGTPFLTEEAAGYLLEVLDPHKDEKEIEELKSKVATLAKLPRAVTPILIPLEKNAPLDALLARDARVRFDVDGHGREGTWSWITPRAGWLVQLPREGREVRSGLQLFGSVTWWCFWRDGYEPLAALDDDGDGWLSGVELERLGVWCDRDGNGRSDPGEVRTLAELGIERLACASQTGTGDVVRWSPRGVVFRGGEVRPTWDVALRFEPDVKRP
jgi:hypothetical protein